MRLVHFAGFPKCGKTEIIRRICENKGACFIGNNEASAEIMSSVCENVDSFPFKSPCARIRQYSYRVDLMKERSPSVIITESPGNCLEVSAPMLNQIYINDKATELGPLITVIDGRLIKNDVSKRDSEGLRLYNMIDESDVVVVTFADLLSDDDLRMIGENISEINEDARIIIATPDSDLGDLKELVFGDSRYSRPLYN